MSIDFAFQFPNSDVERTSVDARRRRSRVLRVRIVLYSGSIEGLCERDIRKSKRENYTPTSNWIFTFQFPNSDVERTSVDARRRRSRVLRVRIVVYSGSIEGLVSAIFENQSKKNYTPTSNRYLPSNFRTAALKERLSMPVVAVAVSSVSVSWSTVGQLKV